MKNTYFLLLVKKIAPLVVLFVLGIFFVLSIINYNLSEKIFNEVVEVDVLIVEYATLKKISTSGEARFFQYDIETKELVIDDNPRYAEDNISWFFAMPENVPDEPDYIITDRWVKFLKDNADAVFKIIGMREEDDCGYYGPEHCVKNIEVKSIEVVGEDKKMEF
jgi:hypothetical protein